MLGGEVFPGQHLLAAALLLEAQVAHGKIAAIAGFGAFGAIRHLALGGQAPVGDLQRGPAGQQRLDQFQRQVGQLELEVDHRTGRGVIAFRLQTTAAGNVERQPHRQGSAEILADTLDVQRYLFVADFQGGSEALVAHEHVEAAHVHLVETEAPGRRGRLVLRVRNGLLLLRSHRGERLEALQQEDLALGLAHGKNTAVRQRQAGDRGLPPGQVDARICQRHRGQFQRAVDARQFEPGVAEAYRADGQHLPRQVEAAALQHNRADRQASAAFPLPCGAQRQAQARQLRLDGIHHDVQLVAGIAGAVVRRHRHGAGGRRCQEIRKIGGELGQLQILQAEAAADGHGVEVQRAGEGDLRARGDAGFELEPAAVVGQGGNVRQAQVQRCDAGGESLLAAPIGKLQAAIDQGQAANVEARQAGGRRLVLLVLKGGDQAAPVDLAARQFDQRDVEAVEPDRIEHRGAVRQAGGRNIDHKFAEGQQRLVLGVVQLQVGEAQLQAEGVELRAVQRQAMA